MDTRDVGVRGGPTGSLQNQDRQTTAVGGGPRTLDTYRSSRNNDKEELNITIRLLLCVIFYYSRHKERTSEVFTIESGVVTLFL